MADPQNSNNPKQAQQQQPQTQATPSSMAKAPRAPVEPQSWTRSWANSPFSSMQRLMGEMDRMFGDLAFSGSPWAATTSPSFEMSAWAPRVDIFERGEQLVLHADLPGIRNEDVRVNVDEGVLTISGERRHEHKHESQGVYQCERSYGSFQRAFRLPDGIDQGSVQASFENGVLEVTMPMPKQKTMKGRDIPIGAKPTRPGVSH